MSASRTARVAFAVLAAAFFATPIAARVAGVTAERFENRQLAEPPRLSQGWDAFGQTTRYLTDRMPLREQAVRANTDIWTGVFGTDPRYNRATALGSDQALPFAGANAQDGDGDRRQAGLADLHGPATASTGREGWLFVGSETEVACADEVSDVAVLRRWASLVEAARDDGRTAVMVAVPHKSSVYPEYLPKGDPYRGCALEKKDELWSLLAQKGPELGVVELRSELVRLKRRLGDELFEVTDMHWTTLGALTLVNAALEAAGSEIRVAADEVERRRQPYVGDLSLVTGRKEAARHFVYEVARAEDAPRVPGRTVVVGDSFAGNFAQAFAPYFEDIRFLALSTSQETVDAIRRADHVVFEAVETNMESSAASADSQVVGLAERLSRAKP